MSGGTGVQVKEKKPNPTLVQMERVTPSCLVGLVTVEHLSQHSGSRGQGDPSEASLRVSSRPIRNM